MCSLCFTHFWLKESVVIIDVSVHYCRNKICYYFTKKLKTLKKIHPHLHHYPLLKKHLNHTIPTELGPTQFCFLLFPVSFPLVPWSAYKIHSALISSATVELKRIYLLVLKEFSPAHHLTVSFLAFVLLPQRKIDFLVNTFEHKSKDLLVNNYIPPLKKYIGLAFQLQCNGQHAKF